jgi:2-oxoacid:acceptor oxidoreductase delta subunit (pyruvate/2-ketoisovalerate family)
MFAGGDMVPAERNVTVAVGHGKKAARHIDAWLRGTTYAAAQARSTRRRASTGSTPGTTATRPRPCARSSTWHRARQQLRRGAGRPDEDNALFEARRCLSCGNCFECDNCYGVCPDNAVIKLGPGKRFEFNYDYCKGCGICVAECPCGAIEMVPELPRRRRARWWPSTAGPTGLSSRW